MKIESAVASMPMSQDFRRRMRKNIKLACENTNTRFPESIVVTSCNISKDFDKCHKNVTMLINYVDTVFLFEETSEEKYLHYIYLKGKSLDNYQKRQVCALIYRHFTSKNTDNCMTVSGHN